MTDRTLRSPADLDGLDFARSDGLVPLIVQHAATGETLMLGYANRLALGKTLETGQVHFWSRSRSELWRKGETSGNTLSLVSLHADCDGDAVLARAEPAGPTCHTGEHSCFGEGATAAVAALARLDATLASRASERPPGSYTVELLDDENLRLKKLGEETAELVAALARHDRSRVVEEAADLLYHLLVALRADGVALEDLIEALKERA
ncbi:MAG TPA: bifunctional phosphoribosyl-AMP cyclohydrolase/phosphoribosyl-ATP diphosphatase HisIE [Longimicrobiales bacterium]|nr:bifunctional phosphoribosyl-AMP cyclohydrolase/phosphoribosyl-ATP diphosphatase HisIE [Longimicrobiales bacterium]